MSSRLIVVSPVMFLPGRARLSTNAMATGSLTGGKDDGEGCSRPLRRESRGRVHCKHHVQRASYQFGGKSIERQLPRSLVSVLDHEVRFFDPPVISKSVCESLAEFGVRGRGTSG